MALHDLALSLARQPEIVAFARALVEGATDRVSRVSAVFTFVRGLAQAPRPAGGRPRDGVDALVELVGESDGRAVVLSALLQALGERAQVDSDGTPSFVRVALEPEDVARLPPHARLIPGRDRYYIPLDPRRSGNPLGFLPLPVPRSLGHG